MEFNSLCIIGVGYIGLPTASLFASKGLQVTGDGYQCGDH